MNKGIIVISAGGHATVLIDAMQQQILETIVGIVDVNPALQGMSVLGISVLGDDGLLAKYSPQEIQLVNGLGSTDVPMARALLFKKYKVMGYHFHSVIHPQTIIATSCQLGEGVQVLAGGILQPRVQLADNVIINTRAIVDHDCVLAAHVHVATGAVISGNVSIGQNSHIGAGATILQGMTIGENCLIGAGSVVIRDVPSGSRIAGVPARPICKREEKFAHEKLA